MIIDALRGHARRVYEGITDLPDVQLRHASDPDGDIGANVFLGFASRPQRENFVTAMNAENVPAGPPSGVVVVPTQVYAERKLTTHPNWPSFTSERGRSIRYGAECCPRTIDNNRRCAGIKLAPKFSRGDVDDIVTAIRKVYPAVARA
jgi:hypothetical protein